MKKNTILIFFVLVAALLSAQKMFLQKAQQFQKLAEHPYQNQLIQYNFRQDLLKKDKTNFNRLLVILVDFAEEYPDDPNTTGNGKFQLEPDLTYIYSVGAPPH
ncbi:MAG: hypothetical protein PHE75_08040, partial [Candidatus Cloacimonas acidaminovorans]|nr:hypothetical protein [Candidatus Cloacimonas acidaminovorans]